MTMKLNIEIEYGRASGGFREAVRVMQDVMREHDYDITSFKFILGKEEKFDVRIDGELVFSRRESGRVPGVEEIKGAVKARLHPLGLGRSGRRHQEPLCDVRNPEIHQLP